MKKVAFLSYDWDYKIVSEYYLGLQDYLKSLTGIQVFIFNGFGPYHVTHMPHKSCFEVFTLADFDYYDGFIIQGNRTWPPKLRQKIVDKAVALGKPIVSINYDLEGAHSVGTDNYQEMFNLVSRVLTERRCSRPAYVNGLKTSTEASDRAQGYRDACVLHGIEGARVYQANWQKEAGVMTAKKMLAHRDDLPDVIFCCNDYLAVGVQETLQAAGVRVPEDVMVTGFDNNVSQTATPQITTIDRSYHTISKTALDTLMRLIDGEDVPQRVFSPAEHQMRESCGYASWSDSELLRARLATDIESDHFMEVMADFQRAILDADSLYALLENCELFARELDCTNVCLSLTEGFLRSDDPRQLRGFDATSHLMARKDRDIALRCDGQHVYGSFETRDLLPPNMPADRPLYLVSPLRHNGICMGTVVTDGVPMSMTLGFNAFFLTPLAAALMAARKSELLQAAYEQLGK